MSEKLKARKYIQQIEEATKDSAQQIPIFNENRDFIEFEFMFFFYFVYDYRIFHKLEPELRKTICNMFVDGLYSIRKASLSKQALDELFNNRINAFFTFIKKSKTVADFLDLSSDYINALLTISIDEDGYANGSLGDLPKIKETIRPDIFTAFIGEALSLQSWTVL